MAADYRYAFWYEGDNPLGRLYFRDDITRDFCKASWSKHRKFLWFYDNIKDIPSEMFNKVDGTVCADGRLIERYLKG